MKQLTFTLVLMLIFINTQAQDYWVQKSNPLNVTRNNAAAFSIGNYGYMGLGIDDVTGYCSDLWQYNPADNTWTQKQDFPSGARTGAFGFSIAGKGYMGTGSNTTPGSYAYTVTITDINGCTATAAKTITVSDIRCGKDFDKVAVCMIPQGNPHNMKATCINGADVADHLRKGSYLGDCNTGSYHTAATSGTLQGSINEPAETSPKDLLIYPNPNHGSFILQVNNAKGLHMDIRVIDQNGKIITTRNCSSAKGVQSLQVDLGPVSKGVYTIQAITGNGITTTKMIVY